MINFFIKGVIYKPTFYKELEDEGKYSIATTVKDSIIHRSDDFTLCECDGIIYGALVFNGWLHTFTNPIKLFDDLVAKSDDGLVFKVTKSGIERMMPEDVQKLQDFLNFAKGIE